MANSVDPDQMPHSVCKGLSVPILRVIMPHIAKMHIVVLRNKYKKYPVVKNKNKVCRAKIQISLHIHNGLIGVLAVCQ